MAQTENKTRNDMVERRAVLAQTACAGMASVFLGQCHALTALPPRKVPTVLSGQ